MFDVCRHPKAPDTITHGWRWYRVQGDRLISPLVNQVPLPRGGVLDGAYFIPHAEQMHSLANMIRAQNWYEFALTFGTVEGPFELDKSMPRVGSMSSTRYQARLSLRTTHCDSRPHMTYR